MVKKITYSEIIGLYLNDYNKRHYLRELAALLKKPHQTVKPYINKLVKENILVENKRTNIIEYYLNFKNKRIYDYLTIAEKEKFIQRLEGDNVLRVLFEKLSSYFKESIFVVFGSSVDKIREGSDIDLLIIGKQNISKSLENFENIYNRKIHKIQVADIKKLTSTLIKEIFKKHLIFNNTEQVIRYFGGLNEENKLV